MYEDSLSTTLCVLLSEYFVGYKIFCEYFVCLKDVKSCTPIVCGTIALFLGRKASK